MGNSTTVPILGVDEDHQIKWKQGLIDLALPFSHNCKTYEQLRDSKELKDYILHNLDDDCIGNMILDCDSCEEHLLKPLHCFREYSSEERSTIEEQLKGLENCSTAGVNVKLSEAIRIVTQHLSTLAVVAPSQYTQAMQRKFTLLSFLGNAMTQEYDQYIKVEKDRKWNEHGLNSIEHPQTKLLMNSYQFGMHVLKLLGTLSNTPDTLSFQLISSPVMALCDSMKSSAPLQFFQCWSPRQALSRKLISSNQLKIVESTPQIKDASILSVSNIEFGENRSSITIYFNSPKDLSVIELSWLSSQRTVTAPKQYSIYVKKQPKQSFQKFGSFDADAQKIRCGSWNQEHWLHTIQQSNDLVDALKITVSQKLSKHNGIGKCCLHAISLYEHDPSIIGVQTIDLFQQMNSSLYSLMSYPTLKTHVFAAIFGNIKSSGSLCLLLDLMQYVLKEDRTLQQTLSLEESVCVNEFTTLLSTQEETVIAMLKTPKTDDKVHMLESICNDHLKSENCKILDDKTLAFSQSASGGFCTFKTPTANVDILELDFTTSEPNNVQVGFIAVSDKYESPLDVKRCSLLRLNNGQIRLKEARMEETFAVINAGDRVKLFYDYKKEVVLCSINDQPSEILFESWNVNCLPVIVCDAADHEVSVTVTELKSVFHKESSSDYCLQHPPFIQVNDQSTYLNSCSVILQSMAWYCQTISQVRTTLRKLNLPDHLSGWEYPFGIDISLETFQNMNNLLNIVMGNPLVYGEHVSASLISILQLQLNILCESSSPLSEILLMERHQYGRCVDSVGQQVFTSLSLQLQDLIKNQTFCARDLAMQCFSSGSLLFYPRSSDRIAFLSDVLNDKFAVPDLSTKNDHVLQILGVMNRVEELNELVDLFMKDTNVAMTVSSSISIVIETVSQADQDAFFINNIIKNSFGGEILSLAKSFLLRFFEHLFISPLVKEQHVYQNQEHQLDEVCCQQIITLVKDLMECCSKILNCAQASGMNELKVDELLRKSLIGDVTLPLLHFFTMKSVSQKLLFGVIDTVTSFATALIEFSNRSNICKEASFLIASGLSPGSQSSSGVKGWRTVKACFDDGDGSYTLSDNGMVYTSSQSSNTSAFVNYRFTKGQRGAWEFLLESDSNNDECSVFGAARMPLSSRCYTSSPDLWMRRSYNGYMYCLGQTTGNNLEKIHPNDIVRIEYDGIAGTLSYSINGGEFELGFSNIVDDVYPACGSYRSNVGIRLLKVEVFDSLSTNGASDEFAECYPTCDIAWRPLLNGEGNPVKSPSNCLNHPEALDSKIKKTIGGKWLTSCANRGAAFGLHRWNLRVKSDAAGSFSIGVVVGSYHGLPSSRRLSVVIPQDIASNQEIESHYFSWNSDGSLWCDGKKVSKSFGLSVLPLKKGCVISLLLDRTNQTLEFLVNNKSIGKAFGPESSNACCNIPIPEPGQNYNTNNIVYPAASIFSLDAVLEISSAGFQGSTVVPFIMSSAFNLASVCGRLTAGFLESDPTPYETEIHDLLESPMFIGGLNEDSVAQYVALNSNFNDLHRTIQVAIDHASQNGSDSLESNPKDCFDNLVHTIASSSLDGTVKLFYDWLDSIDPEPLMMRKILEKSSSYNFPTCELPVLASMIKHSEIEDEVRHFFNNPDLSLIPSDNLNFIWQKVKQLRNFLRKQRQMFRSSDESNQSFDWNQLTSEVTEIIGLGSQVQWYSVEVVDQTNDLEFLQNQQPVIQSIGFNCDKTEAYLSVGNYCETKTLGSISLIIQEKEWKSREFFVTNLGPLVAWFDLSNSSTANLASMKSFDVCIYDKSSSDPKVRSRLSLGIEQKNALGKNRFEQLCEEIQAKANFLLMLRPTFRLSGMGSKLGLVGLSSIYSTPFTPFASSKADLSRRKTQERWKRVVEYLHVQSKLHRQLSTESSDNSENSSSTPRSLTVENTAGDSNKLSSGLELSNCQAAIQTCAGFILSDSNRAPFQICNISRVLQNRVLRSQYRHKGFTLIDQMLQLPGLYSNMNMLMEYLGILKNSFPPKPFHYPGSKKHINHYLATLEGCPTRILSYLQNAAGKVYKSLSHVLEYVVEQWEKPIPSCVIGSRFVQMDAANSCFNGKDYGNVVSLLIQLWSGEFSSRDSQWIGESGIVQLLHKLGSHVMQEKIFAMWDTAAERLVNFTKLSHASLGDSGFQEVSLWSVEKVEQDLASGTLTAKQLLVHLIIVCASNVFDADGEATADPSLANLLEAYVKKTYDFTQVFKHFVNLTSRWTQKMEKKKKQVQVKTQTALSKEAAKLGCFDPEHKAAIVSLSDNFRAATLRQNGQGTSVCVYGSFSYSATNIQEVGNYFEVTIVSGGEGDIGVGFANQGSFAPTGHMPGWVAHSYGYHGDDGKKYGEGSTSGDWPLFEDGDVIGCGIDFTRRAIFYTRNGELLGDGFSNIVVEEYWPIIGFSNRHDETNKVRINFGLTPFVYSSPDTIVPNTFVAAHLTGNGSNVPVETLERFVETEKETNESTAAIRRPFQCRCGGEIGSNIICISSSTDLQSYERRSGVLPKPVCYVTTF